MDPQFLCDQALALQRQGSMERAELLYRQVLGTYPANFTANYFLGVIRLQQGRSPDAVPLLAAALKTDPGAADAHIIYGLCLQNMEKLEQALASYDQALKIQPNNLAALVNRGTALRKSGKFAEALDNYDRALALDPAFSDALTNRGAVLRELGRPEEALASFDAALSLQPSASAWFNRGTALQDLRRFDEALKSYDAALAVKPDFPSALYSKATCFLAMERPQAALQYFDATLAAEPAYFDALAHRASILRGLGRLDEALASYERAIHISSAPARFLHGRGDILRDLGNFAGALASYERALIADPSFVDAHIDRANLLRAMGRPADAISEYDRAIGLAPNRATVHFNRAGVLLDMGLWNEAIAGYERTLAIEPAFPYAQGDLLHARMQAGDWRDLEQQVAVLDAGVRAGKRIVHPFAYQSLSDSPADLLTCSAIFARDRHPAERTILAKTRARSGKIRIGYVCGEFREHATGYLMAGLFEKHDRDRFEVLGFDNGWDDNSSTRQRLEAAFDDFISIAKMPDQIAAHAIASREIDILVNLNGYCGLGRMGIFARKPAPIQVNYLGFPGSLGASYMDYILADGFIIPESERRHYSEQVVYLPDTYWVNDVYRPLAAAAPTRASQALPEAAFVFCNFNQSYKLNPMMFATWMRILAAAPGSVLWLLENNPDFAENMRQQASCHGVAPTRLIFAKPVALEQHLARIGLADLFLDTAPYNAHTTACDSLRAGVPVLTCRGSSFAGRVVTSLLHAVGLPELVMENRDDYETLALKLAGDAELLRHVRNKLAHNLPRAPLFDTDRFRRHIEAAYATMVDISRNGESPLGFTVAAQSS
jgi:predicted O-linked N-acetylglucosamine transferase (SPINDLY family)